jgi:serine/threonine-protein kinase
MSSSFDRYQIKEIIGEGGMGIVYRAVDLEMQSDVAVKTIKEVLDPQQIELFRRECAVLRRLRHPNVVDVFDFGIAEEKGREKPFFVMPYLPGFTLDKLIRSHAARLTPDRVVDIVTQTARGLQSAHDQGLVHRDVKPSNIFVLSDDSVKLIDFGVVHLTDQHSLTGLKGTLPYMSPEQLELNPASALSDVFSLAVVCYEALTRRRPFNGNNESEIRESILHSTPPPVFELNPAVSMALSQVVHAAMAKQPWHRTSTARQFAEELQKALHGQPIDRFDPVRIEPRIARAQKALEASQYDFAAEILNEIEAEGHIHPTIRSLRRQIDQALRAKAVKAALESAQHRFAENEYQLALQKVDEVLRLDTTNAEALTLKSEIDEKHRNQQIENWFRLAKDHIQNYAYNHARQALQNVLRLNSTNTTALQMLADVDRRENEYFREHQEKEELYKSALEAWHRGEVSVALTKLERVLELDRRAPDSASSESALSYQNLYNQVRSERDRIKNAYEEARKHLNENDFTGASSICEQVLAQYPGQALFQALKFDIGERQRQYVSSYIVKIDREVEAEPDLDRKVAILAEAHALYPEEAHFRERLDRVTQRRDLVASITEKIRNLDERGQYSEALSQLEILRAIYPQYRGLDLEIDRITKRRDQQSRADARARWVNQIDRGVSTGDFSHALNLLKSALAEFPDDPELLAQERLARDGQDRCLAAIRLFETAQTTCAQGEPKGGLDLLWQAYRLDDRNALIRAFLVETLLKQASTEIDRDQNLSERLVSQAVELDPINGAAANLQRTIRERQKDRAVDLILSRSREVQASGDVDAALALAQKGLESYPDEQRLVQRRNALLEIAKTVAEEKERNLKELRELKKQVGEAKNEAAFERSRVIYTKYAGDPDVESVFRDIEDEWAKTTLPKTPSVGSIPKSAPPPKEVPASKDKIRVQRQFRSSVSAIRVPRLRDRIQSARQTLGSISTKQQAIIGVIPIVLMLGVLISEVKPIFRRPPTPPPPEAEVVINSSFPGAHLLVNGEDRDVDRLTLNLREGKYKFDAVLPGYVSRPVELEVKRGATVPPTVTVPLDPLPPLFRVSTEFLQGSLDNEKMMLDGTGFDKTDLANGPHVLQLSSPVAGTIKLEFEVNAGQLPVVRKVESPQTLVVGVATLGDRGQLTSSSKTLRVSVNGQNAQEVGEQAMPLSLISDRNVLAFDDSKDPVTVTVQADANPRLDIFVGAPPNAGNLEVTVTGPAEASVSVEPADKKGPARTQKLSNGRATFSRLLPKAYNVEVSAPGYESARKSASVLKGDVATIVVPLNPVPSVGAFEIHGGTPDAEIFLDNNPRAFGRLSSTGDFTSTQIPAGRHRIQLRKSDFEDSPAIDVELTAGATRSLSGAQVTLRQFGRIEFNVLPAATITYSASPGPGTSGTAKNGDAPHMRAGRYLIIVKAQGESDYTEIVEVQPGFGTAFNHTHSTTSTPPPPPPKTEVSGPEILVAQSGFSLSQKLVPGVYTFRIRLHGFPRKRARWVANFRDTKNYIEYEIDEKNLKYTIRQNGTDRPGKTVPHSVNRSKSDAYDVTVDVGANAIGIFVGGERSPIDSPTSGENLLAGKFGFPEGENWDNFQFTTSVR